MTFETCPDCGTQYTFGQLPWCPHGRPVDHHPFVPYIDEHVQEKPVLVTSHYHRRKLMRQNNCDFAPRKRGMPGQEI